MEILPMTEGNLEEAINLINLVFPPDLEEESAGDELPASLFPEQHQDYFLETKVRPGLRYWVAIDEEEKIVGTIGLYEYEADHQEAIWLGWFAVHPAKRNRGVGTTLLSFAIGEAGKEGKKYLRLYTGDDPEDLPAHRLYEKHGFQLVGREPKEGYTKVYYELEI